MPQDVPLFELEGDFPVQPPSKSFSRAKAAISRTESDDSLKPAPLKFSQPAPSNSSQPAPSNFSRPAYNFSRPRLRLSDSDNERGNDLERVTSPAEYTAGPKLPIHQPYMDRRLTNGSIPEVVNEEEEEGDDVDSFMSRTEEQEDSSDDDSAPPPVMRTAGSGPLRELSSFYNTNLDDARPGPGVGQGSATWIYKPYAESFRSTNLNSDASSIFTATTTSEDFTDGDDASSIAESAVTSHSSISDFAFDGQLGWNPRANPPSQAERERQRWTQPPVPAAGPIPQRATSRGANAPIPVSTEQQTSNNNSSSTLSAKSTELRTVPTHQTTTSATSSSSTPFSQRPLQSARPVPKLADNIVKRTSFDQQSLRITPDRRSDSMSSGSASVSSTEWQGSDFDTSGLSPEKIKKLKKKGINPALYAEMQQARKGQGKGKRWVSPLTGNTFLS